MSEVMGIDVSHHQGEMDWEKAKSKGIDFAISRVGFGSAIPDVQWERNLKECKRLQIPFGAYYYPIPEPGFNIDSLVAKILDQIIPANLELPLFIDIESSKYYDPNPGIMAKYIDIIYSKYKNIGIYTRGEFWNTTSYKDLSKYCVAPILDLPLWIARYSNVLAAPWSDSIKYRPTGYTDWDFWQYSADGNGKGNEYGAKSDAIDLNHFNGSKETFYSVYGKTFPIPEPEKEEKQPIYAISLIDNLNMRSRPTTSFYNVVGKLSKNEKVPILDVYIDSNFNSWVLVMKPNNLVGWSAVLYRKVVYMELQ